MSSNDAPQTVRRTQQFGAAGFVSKSTPVETLAQAIMDVLDVGSGFLNCAPLNPTGMRSWRRS